MNLLTISVVSWRFRTRPLAQNIFAVRRMHSSLIRPLHIGTKVTVLGILPKLPTATASRRSISWLAVISTSTPVVTMQQAMMHFHEGTHLPWWTTILLTTFAIRFLLTFPLSIYQNYIIARYANIQPEIASIAKELGIETTMAVKAFGWDEKTAKRAYKHSLRKQIRLLIERDNCHPVKASLVLWIQLPAWISVSFALRNLCSQMPNLDLGHYPLIFDIREYCSVCQEPVFDLPLKYSLILVIFLPIAAHVTFLEMCEEGLLWIPNLTFPDTSLIFPVLFGLLNLAIVEIHALRTLKHTRFQKILTNCFRGFGLVMIPIAASVPSCLVLYWTTSSVLGLSQNLMLMSPRFRRMCHIPAVVGESPTPYRDLVNNLKIKLKLKQVGS